MHNDQNSNRREGGTQVIAVTGGKGGVGKTSISINLAIALSDLGRNVTLFDADLGLANVPVLLGLHPIRDLSHVINGECHINDVLIEGPNNVNIVPASSGVKMMSSLTTAQHHSLISAFDELSVLTDTLIIDTAAGISDSVISFCAASHEILIVLCNDPASITDAYALIKILNKEYKIDRFKVLVNMADSPLESHNLFMRLVRVSEKYLDVVLKMVGSIPRDKFLMKSLQQRRPHILNYPSSPAAISLKDFARTADNWPRKSVASGKLGFFVDRIVKSQPEEYFGVSI